MADIFRSGRPNVMKGTKALQCYFWNDYRVSHHAISNGQVHRVGLEKRWNQREQTGLWSMVAAPTSISGKATVRRHHLRRLRNAFKEACNARGWDGQGKSSDPQVPTFRGTLHLLANSQIIQTAYPDLRTQCANILDKMVDDHRKGKVTFGLRKRTPTKNDTKFRTQNQNPSPRRPTHNTTKSSVLGDTLKDIRKTQSKPLFRKV